MALLLDTTEINGRLEYINSEHNGDAFILANSPGITFHTAIHFTAPNERRRFGSIAAPGDSIIKHRYSDTIILIKNNITYYAICWRGENL